MLREKPEVERALRLLGEGDRYRVQWGREEHAGRKIYLGYRNGLGSDDHIELDVNFLHRVPLVPPIERNAWTPDPDFPCRAVLAGTEEILAGKILALLDRGAPRDLYDVASIAGGRFRWDADLFRPLFVALSGVLDRPATAYPVPHPTLSQAQIEEQLIPVLRQDERPDGARLTVSVASFVSSLVKLSEEEQEYVEQIQWGEFRPELVIKNHPELLARIRRHPALLWKVENGRRRRRG